MSLTNRNRQTPVDEPLREVRAEQQEEYMIPVSKLRTVLRRIAIEGGYLKFDQGAWRFANKTPFTGLNVDATYASEDQAVDTVVGIYLPEIRRAAA